VNAAANGLVAATAPVPGINAPAPVSVELVAAVLAPTNALVVAGVLARGKLVAKFKGLTGPAKLTGTLKGKRVDDSKVSTAMFSNSAARAKDAVPHATGSSAARHASVEFGIALMPFFSPLFCTIKNWSGKIRSDPWVANN
jgi:hypothetical protein